MLVENLYPRCREAAGGFSFFVLGASLGLLVHPALTCRLAYIGLQTKLHHLMYLWQTDAMYSSYICSYLLPGEVSYPIGFA